VIRLKKWIRSYSITPLGWVMLVVGIAALVLAGLGPASVQVLAFIVAAGIAVLLIAGGLSGGAHGRSTKSLQDRRAEFGARPFRPEDEGPGAAEDEQLWQRERERREASGR
jgi:hypothetical protein